MTWTPEIVRARFVEAAAVEQRLLVKGGPAAIRTAWPAYLREESDKGAWDQTAIEAHLQKWQGGRQNTPGEVQRYEEVVTWLLQHIADPARRRLVWAWAECEGRDDRPSFRRVCKIRGWSRSTTLHRLAATCRILADELRNTDVPLRLASDESVGPKDPLAVRNRSRIEPASSSSKGRIAA